MLEALIIAKRLRADRVPEAMHVHRALMADARRELAEIGCLDPLKATLLDTVESYIRLYGFDYQRGKWIPDPHARPRDP
jgi:hypothetical protein